MIVKIGKCFCRHHLTIFCYKSSICWVFEWQEKLRWERSLRKTLPKSSFEFAKNNWKKREGRPEKRVLPNSSKVLEFINFPRMQNELPFNKFCGVKKNCSSSPQQQNEEISIGIAPPPPQPKTKMLCFAKSNAGNW